MRAPSQLRPQHTPRPGDAPSVTGAAMIKAVDRAVKFQVRVRGTTVIRSSSWGWGWGWGRLLSLYCQKVSCPNDVRRALSINATAVDDEVSVPLEQRIVDRSVIRHDDNCVIATHAVRIERY